LNCMMMHGLANFKFMNEWLTWHSGGPNLAERTPVPIVVQEREICVPLGNLKCETATTPKKLISISQFHATVVPRCIKLFFLSWFSSCAPPYSLSEVLYEICKIFGHAQRRQYQTGNFLALCAVGFEKDNAPAHKSVLAMGKLRDLHYELLEHSPYSPDLAPSDFFLFQKLKLFLAGQRFSSNQEAIAAVQGYFAELTKNH